MTTITPAVDGFFQKGEAAINTAITNLQNQLTPNGQISNLKGAGSTPHSTFNVGPKGGAPSSQAVQCSHSSQKLKDGLPSASSPTPSPSAALPPAQGASPASSSDDPVADFVTSFTARITNGDLAQKFENTKNQINNLFKANSATQFFDSFVSTLLTILGDLLDGVFTITNALVDGVLGIFDDFVDALMNPTTGLLNAPLDIPFISWLYQLLFNEQLTVINALTLVAAIPATILFRVVEGQYPSAVLGAAERKGVGAQSVQALTPYEFQGYQFFYGCVVIGGGLANGLGDFLGNAAPPLLGWLAVGVSLVATCLSVPAASNATPSAGDWAVFGIGLANALFGLYLIKASDILNKFDGGNAIAVFCGCFMNVMYLMASIFAFNDDGKTNPSADLGLAANIIGSISGMLNFLKYIGATGKTVAVVLDVACAVVDAALAIASALLSGSPALLPRRLHFPFVPFIAPQSATSPQPMQAHPLRLAPALAGGAP